MKRDLLKERRRETTPTTYSAILKLRRRGHRVEPMPGHRNRHLLDGEIVPTSWLVDMARAGGGRSPRIDPIADDASGATAQTPRNP